MRAIARVRGRFVELSATGSSQKPLRTTTKKNTYEAVFGEEFYVPLDQRQHLRGSLPELTLRVMDWDRAGSNEHIGDVKIALGDGIDTSTRTYLKSGHQVRVTASGPAGRPSARAVS